MSDDFFGLLIGPTDGGPAVVVNVWDGISVERWILTAADELGHLVPHLGSYDCRAGHEVETDLPGQLCGKAEPDGLRAGEVGPAGARTGTDDPQALRGDHAPGHPINAGAGFLLGRRAMTGRVGSRRCIMGS